MMPEENLAPSLLIFVLFVIWFIFKKKKKQQTTDLFRETVG